jgi:hypothetical protein
MLEHMRTVTEIIEAVKSLSIEEKEELFLRLSEVDFDGLGIKSHRSKKS